MCFTVAASVQSRKAALESQQAGTRWQHTPARDWSRQRPRSNHQQNGGCQVSLLHVCHSHELFSKLLHVLEIACNLEKN